MSLVGGDAGKFRKLGDLRRPLARARRNLAGNASADCRKSRSVERNCGAESLFAPIDGSAAIADPASSQPETHTAMAEILAFKSLSPIDELRRAKKLDGKLPDY